MIELYDFLEEDFPRLRSWINSKKELVQFAGPIFKYPLSDTQLINYLKMDNIRPMKAVLKSTNEPIGHCELNFENGNKRLSRILIGNTNLRGKNIGEEIVRKMVDLLFKDPETNEVDLNVFDWNIAAIKCYEKVGFKKNQIINTQTVVEGEIWKRVNMKLKKQAYRKSPRQ